MKVTVFGTGYFDLVQGAVLAKVWRDVRCIDVDAEKVKRLKQCRTPIYEPGLEALVKGNHATGRSTFTTEAVAGVKLGDVQFIAIGTPPNENGSADLEYVIMVAETIAKKMERHKTVIDKYTVPVGTADKVQEKIVDVLAPRGSGDLTFDVVSNPEFLTDRSAVNDCIRPDRIIIHTRSPQAEEVKAYSRLAIC